MTGQDYLKQIQKIDTLIDNKLAEQRLWYARATNTTQNLSGDRVQSSGSKQKMSDAMNNYIDIGRQIDRYIDELADKRAEIIKTIEQLSEAEYDVLHKVYVQYLTLDEVADKRGKSRSWVNSIHGIALKKVENITNCVKVNEKV